MEQLTGTRYTQLLFGNGHPVCPLCPSAGILIFLKVIFVSNQKILMKYLICPYDTEAGEIVRPESWMWEKWEGPVQTFFKVMGSKGACNWLLRSIRD